MRSVHWMRVGSHSLAAGSEKRMQCETYPTLLTERHLTQELAESCVDAMQN